MMNIKEFKHRTKIQLRFKDVDLMGHVNNANYLTFLEHSRIQYFHDVIHDSNKWSYDSGIILARIEANYRRPILWKDKITVLTRCSRIGTTSFNLEWIIAKDKKNISEADIYAEGDSVMVCYDYTKSRPVAISEERIERMEKFEGKKLKRK